MTEAVGWIVQFMDENDGTPLTYCVQAPDGREAVRLAFELLADDQDVTDPDDMESLADNTEVVRLWRGEIFSGCHAYDLFGGGIRHVSAIVPAVISR